MTKAGERILEGAREALAIVKGEKPAASITIAGHTYVPKQVMDELHLMQRTTIDIGIKCIERLKEDSQGLTLDNDTIDACATMLRNLRDGKRE